MCMFFFASFTRTHTPVAALPLPVSTAVSLSILVTSLVKQWTIYQALMFRPQTQLPPLQQIPPPVAALQTNTELAQTKMSKM